MQSSKGLNYTLSNDGLSYVVSGIGTCTDTSVVIPSVYNGKPVTKIGYGAFFNCLYVRCVVIPNTIAGIGNSAFKGCIALKNVTIPDSVKHIEMGAFAGCSNLMHVVILGNITNIEATTFYNCKKLVSIVIPSTVKRIGKLAFKKCKMLTTIYYKGTKQQWSNVSKASDNGRLQQATIDCIGEDAQDYSHVLSDAPEDGKTVPTHVDLQNSQTLYIYKGNIRCKRQKHKIISATAILKNISDQDVVINAEYCTECQKYILSYDLFLHYRDKHHVLIGDLKLVTNEFYDGNIELAEESPLHLCGYNVGQKDDYTSRHRHYILAKLIYDGIMEKQRILDYLSSFVRSRKENPAMKLAVSKWEEDISFVQNYNISTQPSTIITKIIKY